MSKENVIKYLTLSDIINYAITKNFSNSSKKREQSELSLTIINDMTYNNIWNAFKRWCEDQTELGYLLQVFPLGTFYYSRDNQCEGISLRVSDLFLSENDLKWDEGKFSYDKITDPNSNGSMAPIQKLNLLFISSELNLPKIYVQNGLNNIFKSLGDLLNINSSCNIDLGSLGSLQSNLKIICHVPIKMKKEIIFNNRVSVKSLLLKSMDKNLNFSVSFVQENNRYNQNSLNNSKLNENNISDQGNQEKHPNSVKSKNLINIANSADLTNHNLLKLRNAKDFDTKFYEKLKQNIRILNPRPNETEKENKTLFNDLQTKSNLLKNSTHSDYNSQNQKIKKIISEIINVPFQNPEWILKDMVGAIFLKKEKLKSQNFPVLFNAYSNTKGAPFTSEKTFIPISHRISSFYSLSLQNFIIDKTTKSIKRLYDEYFFKYKNIIFEIPASEDEEYLALLNLYKNTKKVDLRKETYERYQNYIIHYIPDNIIANIKEEWLVNIIKMCMRAYNLKNSDIYNSLLNNCLKEIIFIYKISMKQSILDYILKHPEQREKLGISVSFRKTKEYAQDVICRPSDDNWEWKKNWNITKIKISNNLIVMCDNVTKIKKYFVKNIKKSKYLDIPSNWNTYSLGSFIDNQRAKIEDEKKVIGEDWKKFVESTLKENKLYKDQLIIYFKSVCGIMSTELRLVILNSIQDYHDFISMFKMENYFDPKKIFDDQFNPKFPFQRSFLEISIKPAFDRMSFCFSDDLSDIHNKLIGIIHDVIKCSQDVERADNMFVKNLEKKNNLWEVPITDTNISGMIGRIDLIIKENLDFVNKVTDLYEPFIFVLNEQVNLEKFKNANPKREEIKKKISYFEEKLKNLRENMPNSLYLNLIRVDCTDINTELRFSLYNFIVDLLKFIQTKNIVQKAKDLNEKIENLKDNLQNIPQDEESLYLYETNLESYKNDKVPSLYHEYTDFLEWVFFYLDYDKYPIFPDLSKNDTMGGIESIVRTAHNTIKFISPAMETFEINLKDKRNIMETQLNKSRGEYAQLLINIRKEIDDVRDNANAYIIDEYFINKLKDIEKKIGEVNLVLLALIKKEELLGAYPTDDEKLEQCKKDLLPLIYYVSFVNELKEQMENETVEIKYIDFPRLAAFIEKSSDIFEIHISKLNNLKSNISKSRERFEAIKFAAEYGRLVYILIEILKFENISDDIKNLLEENKIYCMEFTKIVYDHEKGQDFLKGLKLIDFMRKKELVDKNREHRNEIDKIIEEWENVKSMNETISKVASECSMEFKMENYKDKKFVIITHESFKSIKENIHKNIKTLDDCVSEKENFRYSTRTLMKLNNFRNSLSELCDLVDHLENNQINLEKNMNKANILQKNQDMFMKLKQAEQYYKSLVDFISENPQVMELLKVKDSLIDSNIALHKTLNEIHVENIVE